jgi:hypothetical protein
VDWFALEVRDPTCRMGSYWTPRNAGGVVPPTEARDVFFTTDGAYTFKEQRYNILEKVFGLDKKAKVDESAKDDLAELVRSRKGI